MITLARRRRRRSRRTLAAAAATSLALAVVTASCSSDDSPSVDRNQAVLTSTIRYVVESTASGEGVPSEDGDVILVSTPVGESLLPPDAPRPVIYVVSLAEEAPSAGVQADVAAALLDEVDVRFADKRDEAIDDAEPTAPVLDGGTLILVGDIPQTGNPVDVSVEIYRTTADHEQLLLTFSRTAGEWPVTSAEAVPLETP